MKSDLSPLVSIASHLNNPIRLPFWNEIEEILLLQDPEKIAERITGLIKANQFNLTVIAIKAGYEYLYVACGDPKTPLERALWFLWAYYFKNNNWKRLKRCKRCNLWFADLTKNNTKKFCSAYCRNRFLRKKEERR